MKLTKGKIAKLHNKKRQSVRRLKRNKEKKNRNGISINRKGSTHMANKSLKKYNLATQLVQYGGLTESEKQQWKILLQSSPEFERIQENLQIIKQQILEKDAELEFEDED